VNVGFEHKNFNINYSSKFVGDMRTRAGKGETPANELVSAYYVADLSANVKLKKYFIVFGSINNVFSSTYEVSRRPAGLRPGMPISFRSGLKVHVY
jgi:Fe(3+) dicitrate transport protein